MTGSWPADLVSAAAISATIVTMSVLRNPTLKALAYSLPLPLSIALVATDERVDGSSVVGLALLVAFLWLVRWLGLRGCSIYVADVAAAAVYVGMASLATSVAPASRSCPGCTEPAGCSSS